jgi:superfamily I DNA/RNA helicase
MQSKELQNLPSSKPSRMKQRLLLSWLKPAVAEGKKCAVLMRKRSSMALFVEKLQAQGIEVEVVGLGGLLELPEIVDLVCALKVVQRADSGSELIRLADWSQVANWNQGH